MQNVNKNYIDVTKKWISNANPNSYEIKELDYWIINNKKHKVDGKKVLLDYSKSEFKCAKWLKSTFGGEIFMCPRVELPKNIRTPDYIWNNEYWDLKEIKSSGARAIDNRINGNKKQSCNYIIDVSNNKLSDELITKQVKKLFSSPERKWVDKIIVKRNNRIIIILQRKKGIVPQPKCAAEEQFHYI